jgi:hypothetical protein
MSSAAWTPSRSAPCLACLTFLEWKVPGRLTLVAWFLRSDFVSALPSKGKVERLPSAATGYGRRSAMGRHETSVVHQDGHPFAKGPSVPDEGDAPPALNGAGPEHGASAAGMSAGGGVAVRRNREEYWRLGRYGRRSLDGGAAAGLDVDYIHAATSDLDPPNARPVVSNRHCSPDLLDSCPPACRQRLGSARANRSGRSPGSVGREFGRWVPRRAILLGCWLKFSLSAGELPRQLTFTNHWSIWRTSSRQGLRSIRWAHVWKQNAQPRGACFVEARDICSMCVAECTLSLPAGWIRQRQLTADEQEQTRTVGGALQFLWKAARARRRRTARSRPGGSGRPESPFSVFRRAQCRMRPVL